MTSTPAFAPSRSLLARRFVAAALLPLAALSPLAFAGCLGEEPRPAPLPGMPSVPPVSTEVPDVLEGPFVPIYRPSESTQQPLVVGIAGKADDKPKDTFYLALSRKELGQRWFISSYLTQSTIGLFAMSLGTSVVSFKIQNDKLFIFQVEKGSEQSAILKPELVIEAYPLVKGVKSFEAITNASDYVLFDPAAGLNRFAVLGEDVLALQNTVVFSQNFRKIADGATFEQVWSGLATSPEGPEKLSGTLTFGLRRYAEGEGFAPMPYTAPFFFHSKPQLVKDEGELTAFAQKWNLREGKPITWVISGVADEVKKEPRLADFDFTAAIKAGIESWNQVFGWKALEARTAKEGEEYGQDDLNFFAFDSDKTRGPAFANLRHNPNTGEIRGASIYFPLGLINNEIPAPMPGLSPARNAVDVELPPEQLTDAGKVKRPAAMAWGNLKVSTTCDLGTRSLDAVVAAAMAEGPKMGFSRKEFVERYVANITAHEIGHALGLRHNFKGSLKKPSSSIMDYLSTAESVAMGATPGTYDVAALGYLYGKRPMPPAEPFCTDDQVPLDPDCRDWDTGANPLTEHYIPRYNKFASVFLTGALPPAFVRYVDDMVPHVRLASDPAARAAAYEATVAPVRKTVGTGVKAEVRDFLTHEIMQRLFVRPLETRMPLEADELPPPFVRPGEPVLAASVADLKTFLIDEEGKRSMVIRRNAADLLKRFQHASAAAALMEAKTAIAAKAATLTGNAAIETNDLVGRIDRYVTAYFN